MNTSPFPFPASAAVHPVAVADLHGRADLLDALITHFPSRHLVLLGDYVDRGPDSAAVVAQVRSLVTAGQATALMGNHEIMLIDVFTRGANPSEWREKNGGQATLDSYARTGGVSQLLEDVLWMRSHLKPSCTYGDTLYAHALRPRPAGVNGDPDIHLWGRPTDPGDVIHPLPGGVKRSVHGHTPLEGAPLSVPAPDGTELHFLDARAYESGRLGWRDARNATSGVVTLESVRVHHPDQEMQKNENQGMQTLTHT